MDTVYNIILILLYGFVIVSIVANLIKIRDMRIADKKREAEMLKVEVAHYIWCYEAFKDNTYPGGRMISYLKDLSILSKP